MTLLKNWAGNYQYASPTVHEPETVDEIRRIVAGATQIHALGARHSFCGVADAAELVSLEKLDLPVEIDRENMTVTAPAGIRYGNLALLLEAEGLALHNMASLPHITLAGAVSTATHGSGNASQNLASAVVGLELVTSDGELRQFTRADPDFAGMVVSLGALGVFTRVTLRVEPTFMVVQRIYEKLPWSAVEEDFDGLMSTCSSVSLFTDFGETVNQLWLKNRVTDDASQVLPDSCLGAIASIQKRHPMDSYTGEACTEQFGVPGVWHERLPHFKLEFTPASGAEIQAEYMVARSQAAQAIAAIREIAPKFRHMLLVSEIRTIAADDLWLSTAYQQDTVGIHFSWKLDQTGVDQVLPEVEAALAPFSPRPHWAKHFLMPEVDLADRYPRMGDFRQLMAKLDPRGAFRTPYLERWVLGVRQDSPSVV